MGHIILKAPGVALRSSQSLSLRFSWEIVAIVTEGLGTTLISTALITGLLPLYLIPSCLSDMGYNLISEVQPLPDNRFTIPQFVRLKNALM